MNRAAVLSTLGSLRPECNFENSSDFISDGLLDSFDMVTLVSTLDSTCRICIAGTDVIPDNFKNLDAITKLLAKYGVDS